jgi:hypothetical protein
MFSSAAVPADIWNQLGPTFLKTLIGLALSGAIGAILWPFRRIKKEWIEMKKDQASIHEELVQQRTNCLVTLQQQGVQQIELLTKTVASLDGVRLDLAEQTGCLRALTSSPIRRRRTAKK